MSFAGGGRLGGMTIERDLHETFRGPVYLPGDQAYNAARATWSGALDQRPAVVAEAMDAADVQAAVVAAREHGLPFAVQATGHGTHVAADGGLLLKTSLMTQVLVDPDRRIARISEKDVMNVLDMIKKEFNVDENRTYLMGHSMGGPGTIYLGVKYASIWAAIGAEAPATSPAGINPDNFSLEPAKNVPMIIVQGDMDTWCRFGTRRWIEKMKELKMTHQYVEVPGGDHGSVLTTGAPDIFAFFAKHSKRPDNSIQSAVVSRHTGDSRPNSCRQPS